MTITFSTDIQRNRRFLSQSGSRTGTDDYSIELSVKTLLLTTRYVLNVESMTLNSTHKLHFSCHRPDSGPNAWHFLCSSRTSYSSMSDLWIQLKDASLAILLQNTIRHYVLEQLEEGNQGATH